MPEHLKDMLGRGNAIGAAKALALVLDSISPASLPDETLKIEASFGRVLSRSLISSEDLPAFDRSSVDGYAVRAQDTFGATETAPAYIELSHEILMGEEPRFELALGKAAKIPTGGMLPKAADAVLMFEHSSLTGSMLEAQKSLAPGDNVIMRGEDACSGSVLVPAGERLGPEHMAVAASLGITEVHVSKMPRVAIISTGDEIVPPDVKPGPGEIRDSNSYYLQGALIAEGAEPIRMGIMRDDYASLKDAMGRALSNSDMVLMTGGSSVGAKDMSERLIKELGRVLFHSVALKPGKPLLVGVAEGRLVFGLPGHPRAVQACFERFVVPTLKKLSGRAPDMRDSLRIVRARISRSVHSAPGREENILVEMEIRDGELWAVPLLGKSGLLSSLVRAHGVLRIEPDTIGFAQGAQVSIELKRRP